MYVVEHRGFWFASIEDEAEARRLADRLAASTVVMETIRVREKATQQVVYRASGQVK